MSMSPRLLRPRATGFDPRSISGINIWVDFSDWSSLTLDANSLIQQVNDKSGNAYHGTQGTAANRPSVGSINGVNAANWGTDSNSKSLAWSTSTGNWREVYIAGDWDGGSTFPTFNGLFGGSGAGGGDLGVIGLVNTSSLYGSISFFANFYVNGSTTALDANYTVLPAISSPFLLRCVASADKTINGWLVGMDRNNAGRGWLGKVGEVLSYSRTLTATESAAVSTYLTKKWKV